jgi:hypothetical protein
MKMNTCKSRLFPLPLWERVPSECESMSEAGEG